MKLQFCFPPKAVKQLILLPFSFFSDFQLTIDQFPDKAAARLVKRLEVGCFSRYSFSKIPHPPFGILTKQLPIPLLSQTVSTQFSVVLYCTLETGCIVTSLNGLQAI